MKPCYILLIFLILFSSCVHNASSDTKNKTATIQKDSVDHTTDPADTLVKKTSEIKEISDYKLVINGGKEFWIHKDSLDRILAKIEINHTEKTLLLNINSPGVIKKIKSKYRKSENLAVTCSDSSGVNYIAGDYSFFVSPYFKSGNKRTKNSMFFLNSDLILFLHGCNGFNVFILEVKADSLRLKKVFPDFIHYPDMLIYRTEIDIRDIITDDSVNYFIALRKLVDWADPADTEGDRCDENDKIMVLYYNIKKEHMKKIFHADVEETHYLNGISLLGSKLIVSHSYHKFIILFKDKEGNIVQPADGGYPYENPDLTEYRQTEEAEKFSDTIFINKYLE